MKLLILICALAFSSLVAGSPEATNESSDGDVIRDELQLGDMRAANSTDTMDVEPSAFALSDETYQPDFDYGDEDSMSTRPVHPAYPARGEAPMAK